MPDASFSGLLFDTARLLRTDTLTTTYAPTRTVQIFYTICFARSAVVRGHVTVWS